MDSNNNNPKMSKENLSSNIIIGSASKPIPIPIYLNGSNPKCSDVKLDLTAHNGAQGLGCSPAKPESLPRYDDMLTNLTSSMVAGSVTDLTLNEKPNSEFSSCRNLQKDCRNGRSTSVVSKEFEDSTTKLGGDFVESGSEEGEATPGVRVGPPDGGWGWVVVFASICISSIVAASYTGFSMYYPEMSTAFEANKAVTGWIGSLHLATGNFLGIFFSYPLHRYGSRPVCIIGALITFVGYFISSFATSIGFLYITYGLIAGCGTGMVLLGVLVIVQKYFDKKRAIAAGLAAMGFSLGSLSVGPFLKFLIDRFTWRGAMFVHSAVFLQIIAFSLLYRPIKISGGHKPPPSPSEKQASPAPHKDKGASCTRAVTQQLRAAFDFSLLRDIPFTLYLFSQMFVQISFQTFYQHTPSRAIYYGVDRNYIALLPLVSSIGTGVARFAFSFVANAPCTDRRVQTTITNALAAITQALMAVTNDFTSMLALCLIEGVFFGGGLCILSTLLVDLVGIQNISRSQAILSVALGLGMLISVPFSGFLFDVTQDYNVPFIVTGVLHFVGAMCSGAACVIQRVKRC